VNPWVWFSIGGVAFIVVGFIVDRAIMRVTGWAQERDINRIIADEVVEQFRRELSSRREDPL
jgi:hypothetical protein